MLFFAVSNNREHVGFFAQTGLTFILTMIYTSLHVLENRDYFSGLWMICCDCFDFGFQTAIESHSIATDSLLFNHFPGATCTV